MIEKTPKTFNARFDKETMWAIADLIAAKYGRDKTEAVGRAVMEAHARVLMHFQRCIVEQSIGVYIFPFRMRITASAITIANAKTPGLNNTRSNLPGWVVSV